ncbi:alpha/beta hydrolase [Curtobacterium sp. 9128]|uniref:alpha/beta hydrolase n=1 Tax=Curtobacterium sp. 9128 TaxID=1793722 RepID=UPI0011A6AEFA|nr:prolyl oligopeptidase family serine peptidase [Curtobacterium sp. 9128]
MSADRRRGGVPAVRAAAALGVTALALTGAGVAVSSYVARRAAALVESPAFDADPGLERVTLPASDLPGWVGSAGGAGDRWALFLPGLGSHPLRHQDLASTFRERGWTCLFAAHSARWPARRHAFGVPESTEAVAWIRYAAAHGAREVVLLGWSFGAALWLRALTEPLPVRVRAVVLTGPLVDWSDTIAHGAGSGFLGRALARGAATVLALPVLARIAGQRATRSLRPASAPLSAPPLVVVHSADDRTVPLATSRRLVADWPADARLYVVHGARHGAERDVDPAGWLDAVTPAV